MILRFVAYFLLKYFVIEVGQALFFRARVGLGLHTSGLGFFGLEKFTK
jgi:hypothetical protein